MLPPEQAKLLQVLSHLEQIDAATRDLIEEVAESELDAAIQIRSLNTMLTTMVKCGMREFEAARPRLGTLD